MSEHKFHIFSNDVCNAYFDPRPFTPGTVMIFPNEEKNEAKTIFELDIEKYMSILLTARNVAHDLEKIVGVKRWGLQARGHLDIT